MARQRPLSPHLQIYRLPLTAVLSISHRLTGIALVAGLPVIALALLLAVAWPDGFSGFHQILTSLPGQIFLWLFIYALFFHLCHGIRHLLWDTLHGFKKNRQNRAGVLQLSASILLTILTYCLNNGEWAP